MVLVYVLDQVVLMSATIHIMLSDDICRMCNKFGLDPHSYLVDKLQEKLHTEAAIWSATRFHNKEQTAIEKLMPWTAT
jgi:hypothetical protein